MPSIVIPSEARDLLFRKSSRKKQIPRRFAPRNDMLVEFFNKLLEDRLTALTVLAPSPHRPMRSRSDSTFCSKARFKKRKNSTPLVQSQRLREECEFSA